MSNKVEDLLGYKREELENTSWYQLIYPEDIEQARQQHLKFGKHLIVNHSKISISLYGDFCNILLYISVKEDGSSFSCVLRLIKKDGSTIWVDITAEKSQESVGNSFVCNYIVIE